MCEFNIQEIELFNYRQFEDKKFVLNSRMNVFEGKNGSGKTTVLEAANVVLGAYLAAFKTYVPSRFVFISNQLMQDERLRFQMIAEFYCWCNPTVSLARLVVRLHGILIMSLLVFSVFFLKQDGRTKFGGKKSNAADCN